MEQAYLVFIFLAFYLDLWFDSLFGRSILTVQANLVVAILATLGLFTLIHGGDQLSGLVVFLDFLLLYYFWEIEWFILKRRVAFLGFEHLNEGQINRERFQFTDSKLHFSPVFWTLYQKRVTVISLFLGYAARYHSGNAKLAICVSARSENAR